MTATAIYTSLGVNRASSCAACTSDGLLAFGAGKSVALWNSENNNGSGVHATLAGHAGQVTTFKLLNQVDGLASFVSGDTEGNVRIWEQSQDRSFHCSLSFEADPKSSISAIGFAPSSSESSQTILTGGSDGHVRVWAVSEGEAKEVQRIDFKGKLPLDIEVGHLPGTKALLLVVGLTEKRIQLFTQKDGQFVKSITLEGHEDWVRCLSLTPYPSSNESVVEGEHTDLMLASGSQDNYVRLWRISPVQQSQSVQVSKTAGEQDANGLDLLDEFERKLAGEAGGSVQISTKAHMLSVEENGQTKKFDVTLEALLMGHEAGLTNVHWSPLPSVLHKTPVLLSTASDNSLVIWTPSSQGIWIPSQRFGTLGGRGLAFYGAVWGKDGKSVMAGGWNGGWERWVREENQAEDLAYELQRWEAKPGLAGHYGDVQSVAWDPKGDYLVSVSSDQTTRIHAPCMVTSEAGPSTWAEIARPQIHGYDMADVAWISSYRIASAADEKVARVFDAPGGFVESLAGLGVVSGLEAFDSASRPKGATVPPLGLSNRALGREAVELDLPANRVPNPSVDSVSKTLTTLPTEDELSSSTLWPEVEKVYGHGYELVAIAASHDGTIVASACRASNPEHAVVRLHSTSTWDTVGQPLSGHTLTITRIAFSQDDQRILTCSRDRGWRLYKKVEAGGYELESQDERAHSRMVLDCCWSSDGKHFATASRDKTVKVWAVSPNDSAVWIAVSTTKLTEAVTAVDMVHYGGEEYLALGTESGAVGVYHLEASRELAKVLDVDKESAHVGTVNRLAWRPKVQPGQPLELASCADDRSVRIHSIQL